MQESLNYKTKSLLGLMTNELDGLHMEDLVPLENVVVFFFFLKKKERKNELFGLLRIVRFGWFTISTSGLSGS